MSMYNVATRDILTTSICRESGCHYTDGMTGKQRGT